MGGGINCYGSLTITGSIISSNSAKGGNNGYERGYSGSASGGGIDVGGSLSLSNSELSNNTAIGGSDSLSDSNFSASGGTASGGAIYALGRSTLSGDTLNGNSATGGICGQGGTGGISGPAFGGAIFSSNSLAINTSSFSGNSANGAPGPLDDNGPGSNASGGAIAAEGTLSIANSTVSGNMAQAGAGGAEEGLSEASGLGGGIYATQLLTITNSTISGNTAKAVTGDRYYGGTGGNGEGGGVFSAGAASISTSTVAGNFSLGGIGDTNVGGPQGNGGVGEGGGIMSQGTLALSSSTISGNQSTGGAGGYGGDDYRGNGGNATGGGIDSSNTLTIINSTVAGNTTTGGAGAEAGNTDFNGGNGGNSSGGGIFSAMLVTLSDCTVVQNTAVGGTNGTGQNYMGVEIDGTPGVGDGGGIYTGKNTLLNNSVLSANNADSGGDVYSTLSTSSGYNLIGYGGGLTNGVNGNQMGIHDPLLAALGSYGGLTQTMPPLQGSPVINAGSNGLIPSGITTDQRGSGYPRIVGSTVDIGAVEYQSAQSVPSSPVITLTAPAGQSATVGQNKSFTVGSFTESNAVAPFSVTVNWGDGSASTVATGLTVGSIPAQTHTFAVAGSETVSVFVSDASGNQSAAEIFKVVTSAPALSTQPTTPVAVSATTLMASTIFAAAGTPVTFIAGVIGNTGTVPTGMMTFSSNGVALGTASLVSGIATFTTSSLASGTDTITASYGGDTHYLTSALSPVAVSVYTPSLIIPILLAKPALPAVVVEGQPLKSSIALLLTNTGTVSKELFTIKWFLNNTASLDGSQTLIATTPKRLALGTGRQARITQVIRSLPASLPAGNFYLIAEMTDPKGAINVIASQSTVTLAAPFISISASLGTVTPATITTRRAGSIVVTLTNTGNITATGLLKVMINPSTNDVTSPLALATLGIRTSIRAGKSKVIRVRLKVAVSLAAGTYIPMLTGTFDGQALSAVGVSPFSVG